MLFFWKHLNRDAFERKDGHRQRLLTCFAHQQIQCTVDMLPAARRQVLTYICRHGGLYSRTSCCSCLHPKWWLVDTSLSCCVSSELKRTARSSYRRQCSVMRELAPTGNDTTHGTGKMTVVYHRQPWFVRKETQHIALAERAEGWAMPAPSRNAVYATGFISLETIQQPGAFFSSACAAAKLQHRQSAWYQQKLVRQSNSRLLSATHSPALCHLIRASRYQSL